VIGTVDRLVEGLGSCCAGGVRRLRLFR